jgi:hypothetical protein
VKFGGVKFKHAMFHGTRFRSRAAFGTAQFGGLTEFGGATFSRAPDFTEANFDQPPRLDFTIDDPLRPVAVWPSLTKPKVSSADHRAISSNTPPASNTSVVDELELPKVPFLLRCMGVAGDREAAGWFRALKRRAANGHDHYKEIEFFAQETRCQRFWEDLPFGKGASRFWFGWLYEKFSNFGRSLVRPFVTWIIATVLIWPVLYLWLGARPQWLSNACLPHGSMGAYEFALQLSVNGALLRSDWLRTDPGKIALGCLYGTTGKANLVQMPLSVTLASVVQNVVSAVLLFLFVLALRNLLRLK